MRRILLAVGLTAALVLPAPASFAQPAAAPIAQTKVAEPSARALDLSRRYFKAMRMEDSMGSILDNLGPLLATSDVDEEADPAEADAMREAARDALNAAMPAYIEKITPVFAQAYTEEELEALVAFYESPVGQAVVAKSRGLGGVSSDAMKELLPAILDDAMERYCAKMGCEEEEIAPLADQDIS